MKKVLSLVLVAAMLVCGIAIIPSAQAATLDEYNVATEAYYFGGEVNFSETLDGGLTWSDAKTIKEGDASKGAILLNGKIEDGEWGDPVVHVDSAYAANNAGQTYGKNTAFETPSAENTYYYYTLNPTTKKSNTPKGLNFDLYLMWDEDYLYVASHVVDNDGYGPAGNAGEFAWNGDAFQFRVDPLGPNSSVPDNAKYNAVGGTETYVSPWAGITYTDRHQITHETVGNFIIACTLTYTETYDAALRYDPEEVDYTFADGSVGTITKYKGTDANYLMYDYGDGIYGSAAYIDTSPNIFSKSCTMDYEVAVPWSLIADGYTAVAGNELGIAAALLNGKPGAGEYNAWLGWGTGICKSQMENDPQTAGGSNSLTLSATPYTTSRCTHSSFNAATCVAPETCTECGYERGYKTGHDYSFSDVILPTAGTDGSITGTCSVCGDVAVTPIPKSNGSTIQNSFTTTDTAITNKGFNAGFTTEWRETSERDEKGDRIGALIYNKKENGENGTVKNAFDNTTFPEIGAVLDLYSNGSDLADVADGVDNEDQAGTYFDIDTWRSNYCYKMDVYFPDLTTDFSDGSTEGHYNPGIRNWFGKDTNYGFYSAGLFKIEDEYYFAVIDARTGDSLDTTKEEFEAAALSYTKATAEDMTTETWHTYALMFVEDEKANTATAVFAWDGKIVAAASDYHMGYQYNEGTCMFRRYSMGMYLKDVIFGSGDLMNNYVNGATEPSDTYTVTIDGVVTEHAVGETVSLDKAFYVSEGKGYRFSGWSGDTDVLEDASIGVTSFTMPARNITLTSSYVIVGDANGDGKINGTDINFMKRIIAGTYSTSLSMDINGDGSWNGTDANMLKRILAGTYTPDR